VNAATTVPDQVDGTRLRDDCVALVSIPSPTGDTLAVAEHYGSMLTEAGMDVILDRHFPKTPIVIGRLAGDRPGPTIVLNGHLDTVPIAHAPARVESERVYGRGSADMKGAMACALEVVRTLVGAGRHFPGELVVVGIGLHEAPDGRGEDLAYLLRQGDLKADAAIVMELGGRDLPLRHMGSATFEVTISRPGMPTHELYTAAGTPHPIVAAARVIEAMADRTREFEAVEYELVGRESYFTGEVHGGDFYNRFPTTCRIVGTRRWAPHHSFETVRTEFQELVDTVAVASGCQIDLDLRPIRGSYQIDAQHPLVAALQAACDEVTGSELPIIGLKIVADAAIWMSEGGVPAIYHGPVGDGAHADVEYVSIAELERATRVYLATLRNLWKRFRRRCGME
jgi:acetylornithine deacetylase/succinyl-diaminopimelate desuccinylase-like protein